MVVLGPIPPQAEKRNKGVKEPCLTSLICWSYILLFSFSCLMNFDLVFGFWLEDANGLNTLTSKNASTQLSSCALADLPRRTSPVRGCRCGSVSVEELTSSIRVAVRSRMSLCLWMGRPPFVQLRACCMHRVTFATQTYGRKLIRLPAISQCQFVFKSPLWRENPCSSTGRVPSHADAPFSCAKTAASLVMLLSDSMVTFISSSCLSLFCSLTLFSTSFCWPSISAVLLMPFF